MESPTPTAEDDDAQIIFRPQPGPQEKFLASSADIAIYGGAAGGGKTWGLLLEPLRHITTVPGYGAVIFRRTSKQVKTEGGMWDETYSIYPHLGAVPKETTMEWVFPPYENSIRFAHIEHEKNRYDYQGAQIPYLGWDELTHFTEEQFFYLISRNRSTCGVPPYIRGTTNPDADSWVAELISWWINQETGFPIQERAGVIRWFVRPNDQLVWADTAQELLKRFPGRRPKSLTFIPANVNDNAILMSRDPGYIDNLYTLPPVERARLLEGNWKIRPASGLIFNRTWFGIIDQAPHDVIARVRYWDKAGSEDTGKYSAGILMSRTPDGVYIVEDVVRGQWGALQRERVILHTAKMDGDLVDIWVEQEPGSGGKESAENTIRMLAGYAVHAERPTGEKIVRANPLSAQAEAHNVKLVRAGWNRAFLDELDAFPEGAFSDQVDSASGAFNKLASVIVVDEFDESELQGEIPAEELGGSFLR